jgi:hypothetical protein
VGSGRWIPATQTEAAAPGAPVSAPAKPARAKRKDSTVAIKASLWLLLILAGGLGILYGVDYLSAWLSKFF